MLPTMMRKMEASVEFKIGAPNGISGQELESIAFAVLDAIESGLGEVAIGPAIACDFANDAINLLFDVEGGSESGIHAQIGRVVQAIESTLGSDHPLTTTKAPAEASSADALAC
jgi:hypothetical protein